MKHKTWAAMALLGTIMAYRWSHQYEDWRSWTLAILAGVLSTIAVNMTVSAAKRGE
jgi:hypothetical protein